MNVLVVGAGVIGASIAWRAAEAGLSVTVVTAPEPAASWVAGGMLAPVTEAWHGETPLLELGEAALARWPDFAAELAVAAGRDPGLRTDGTLVTAVDPADVRELDRLAELLESLGRKAERLTARETRSREPALGPAVRGGLSVPGDLAVDNRRLLGALTAAGARAGVRTVDGPVTAVGPDGVTLADGGTRAADAVVLAAGAASGRLHPALADVVRPVKGEILRLRRRSGSLPPPTRTVRAVVEGVPVYLVPRDDGEVVLGATQYEHGFDTDVTVEGVRDLLRAAERIVPSISDYALTECSVGLRPVTPDNLPVLGWLEPGVLAATGDGRNGILHAPLTAATAAALLTGADGPDPARAAAPNRFRRDDLAQKPPMAGFSARSSEGSSR